MSDKTAGGAPFVGEGEGVRLVRLQKLLAGAGVGSRRYCETLIRAGRVSIGGERVIEMGVVTHPGANIEVDGKPVLFTQNTDSKSSYIFLLLNKPAGIITSSKDQFGRKTVIDLVGNEITRRLFPVGRLDYNTSGIILLTDDGDFAYRVSHPKFGVEKVYEVLCRRTPGPGEVGQLRDGVLLADGFRTSPARIYTDRDDPRKLTIVLREGKNRQVRKMIEAVGNSVLRLARVAIGNLTLEGVAPGRWRIISPEEADMIFEPYEGGINTTDNRSKPQPRS